ncbi:MAG: inositol monophosphatase family protein [Candidatus Staskawiczbacteria bacterium]|jgi:fructose-1,6-bisphosphatase/inositol monophosphatase family enzyme
MNQSSEECIKILIESESVFKKAGELAVKMRTTAGKRNKHNTGVAGIDIVTEADTAVQEFILTEMAKTKLVECELVAEEDTPSVSKFKGTNGLVLALDPIDGTLIYASTGRFYSTIVTLHNKKDILYTYYNYPEINWSRRISGNKIEDSGNFPKIKTKPGLNLKKIIVTSKPQTKINPEILKKINDEGYEFKKFNKITDEAVSFATFFSGTTAGYYMETPNPYDGLVALHYGQVKKLKIYGGVDISKFEVGDHGPHYSGWYLVLNK